MYEPSTPGALIKTNASELEPFIEGDTTKSGKNDLSRKVRTSKKNSNLSNILQEIPSFR